MTEELLTQKSSSEERKEPKRSFIEYTSVKLKGVERELGRLNRNIELLLYHVFNVTVSELRKGESPDDEVFYSSDVDTLKDELTESRRGPEDKEEITYT